MHCSLYHCTMYHYQFSSFSVTMAENHQNVVSVDPLMGLVCLNC